MNALTDPLETVTRRDVFFLVGFVAFFIFFPPKLSDLVIELNSQCLVPGELERLLLSHEVPVMAVMAVVITEDTPVIHSAD